MEAFSFFFSLYGLVLGLSVATVASGFASAVRVRAHRRNSHLTLMLGVFVLMDIASFWMWGWAVRGHIFVTWPLMYGGLLISVIYFAAAALVFPKREEHWEAPDDHYWAQKRTVFVGILIANILAASFNFSVLAPQAGDWLFWAYQAIYFVPLVLLIFNRRRRAETALLAWMIIQYLVVNSGFLPNSDWGSAHAGIW